MAINLGGLLGAVGGVLGSIQGANAGGIRALGQVATITGASLTQPTSRITGPGIPSGTYRTAAAAPAIRAVGAMVGRSFAQKFPNLALQLQAYRDTIGRQVTRARLWSLLKTYGPEFLISGGILTALAVNELMIAGPGRRRMNPGNVKALRRSMRRVESFHKLCVSADKLRRPRRSGKACKTGGTAFVRQG